MTKLRGLENLLFSTRAGKQPCSPIWIELGYDPHTDTYARALDEGGLIWSGGSSQTTLDENLRALDAGIGEFGREQGLA